MKYYLGTRKAIQISTDGLSLGDHICSLSHGKKRHGIYAGNCEVVCYAGGIIAIVPLDTFSAGGGIDIEPDRAEFTAAEIVRRAKSLASPDAEFKFLSGDHFCKWCRQGFIVIQ